MRIAKKCVLAASPLVMAMLVSPSAAARNSKETALRAEMTRLENVAKAAKSADERDRAISQMDDVLQQCGKSKGCQIVPLLEIYKRSLAIEDSSDDADLDDIDAEDRINVTGLNVPDGANADALLDDRSRNFLARVQMNPAVQAGIRRWLTDMRPSLMTSYENFQYLRPQMAPAGAQCAGPPNRARCPARPRHATQGVQYRQWISASRARRGALPHRAARTLRHGAVAPRRSRRA